MARPQKKGLDYFPFNVDFFSDKKIAIVKARFGANGVMLYIYLLCEIYKNGYYIKWDEDYKFIILDELNLKETNFNQILKFLFNRSLLKSILIKPDTFITSAAIQRRFQEAVKTRKLPVVVNEKLWVLKSDETLSCIKFTREKSKSEINPNKSEINCDKSEIYPQSKVKESKEKSPASGVRLFEIQAYINKHHLNVNAERFYNYYTERGWTVNGKPVRDWQGLLNVWSQREKADYAGGWAGIDEWADPETLEINRRWKEARKKLKEAESNAAKNKRD